MIRFGLSIIVSLADNDKVRPLELLFMGMSSGCVETHLCVPGKKELRVWTPWVEDTDTRWEKWRDSAATICQRLNLMTGTMQDNGPEQRILSCPYCGETLAEVPDGAPNENGVIECSQGHKALIYAQVEVAK